MDPSLLDMELGRAFPANVWSLTDGLVASSHLDEVDHFLLIRRLVNLDLSSYNPLFEVFLNMF
jgi:hypothetical protein